MSIFELLCKTDMDAVMDVVYREGKRKSYCPIRFLTDEQFEEFKENQNGKRN